MELKPCPNCGATQDGTDVGIEVLDPPPIVVVQCQAHGCDTSARPVSGHYSEVTEQQAIEHWNDEAWRSRFIFWPHDRNGERGKLPPQGRQVWVALRHYDPAWYVAPAEYLGSEEGQHRWRVHWESGSSEVVGGVDGPGPYRVQHWAWTQETLEANLEGARRG